MLEEAKKFTKEHHMIEEGQPGHSGSVGESRFRMPAAPSVRTAKRNAV